MIRTEGDFLEWLSGVPIYINYSRYGLLGGHGFVCAACGDDSDGALQHAVENLDGGDIEAIEAAQKVADLGYWWANHPDPAKAMSTLVEKLRMFYFNELNG